MRNTHHFHLKKFVDSDCFVVSGASGFTPLESVVAHNGNKSHARERGALSSLTGFTLIEVCITVGLVALLSVSLFFIVSPAKRFADARNQKRLSDVNAVLNAVSQNIGDYKGTFFCPSGPIPIATSTRMASGAGSYNIFPCIYPAYIQQIPFDPQVIGAHFTSISDYDLGYFIVLNTANNRVTVSAPFAEDGANIFATR
ncbi:hypothetical protein A3A21_03540 [Candidatus Jorgensenbacteria bacterium RIFCSPLOWO2_01_FULL_45_25b]|uniref:Type II secretion system protein GspG C-terminal domain-containing protein n=1 Tax=Candidatus Jorgensenbacteria bacterium RIFCSPLOWO2_01_FULL_45_25b TaxID=1798471 RepID=A0A1F6BZ28_9BACT|nr:MAG: hypothetical protein A3A21_03540 [Candidatus Jorgensenbacteria bacterium RIFCSPLOWO2_01_FULL_45_25b]